MLILVATLSILTKSIRFVYPDGTYAFCKWILFCILTMKASECIERGKEDARKLDDVFHCILGIRHDWTHDDWRVLHVS